MTEPQIKKHLTAEEHAMRRAEMARRRKNLSEKRNEEEKVTKTLFLLTPIFSLHFVFFTTTPVILTYPHLFTSSSPPIIIPQLSLPHFFHFSFLTPSPP